MPSAADSIVLGAGIVGVSVALHLAMRGRSVVLVDRRDAGEETSFGNAGLIQREGVMPYPFPRDFRKLLKYSRNTSTDMHYHPADLPGIAPFLLRYWYASRPANYLKIVKTYEPLIAACLDEHGALIERAGAWDLIEKKGWYRLFRTNEGRDDAFREAEWAEREFGVGQAQLTPREMLAREPGLGGVMSGALHWTKPWSIRDPGALVKAYRDLFVRLGGTVVKADAMALRQTETGWHLPVSGAHVEGRDAVVALGPWAGDLTRQFGYRLPLGVKRGYHMHYTQTGGTPLDNCVHDSERGYMLVPMRRGIRLTTGAEFAKRDAGSTPVQLKRAEPSAREIFPALGQRMDAEPWRGARPCTPDMRPIIGPAPNHKGLWFAFGHAHHGMTLGPATGRLVAEMMTGEAPFVDPAPFGVERFL